MLLSHQSALTNAIGTHIGWQLWSLPHFDLAPSACAQHLGGMSNDGDNDPPKAMQSKRAQQLFGHKGGAKPWDDAAAPKPAASVPPISPSAAYPRDAHYTQRTISSTEPEPAVEQPSILGEVDDEGELTNLHPNYKLVMRVGAVIFSCILLIAAIIADEVLSSEFGFPFGFITGPVLILALFIIIRVPAARYNARGYQISRDRLRVVRGIMWHSDTVVPFGRVQHIDVDQGPIERAMGIATMTLHTAGSHNASVRLPGLGHELAVEMREEIRAHIKRETL